MCDKRGEKEMPAAMREKPQIGDQDAKRISNVIKRNNKLLEERIKQLKAKSTNTNGKRY